MTAGFLSLAFMVTHKGLHNGMVCGVHVGVEWKGALSLAIVRRISLRSDDPILRVRMETIVGGGTYDGVQKTDTRGGSVGAWLSFATP